uniref:Uncharacterized protein n=1 Tax=Arundo donax TaxID=35708 RepID=A0A0A9FHX1_ARUDO
MAIQKGTTVAHMAWYQLLCCNTLTIQNLWWLTNWE